MQDLLADALKDQKEEEKERILTHVLKEYSGVNEEFVEFERFDGW
jgi:hypothetical protein